ncbi:uncharacterized protein PV09_08585 [Verruconis gallopava]|uniref:Brl1/Brr6 domain-containing protein n=1 Tax=Verruconis gallopava TaxID=253628 RepID=A0A0D2A0C8_9PEZI|nr:uncharacterized protein PV09_08585 [Verruconis gallopava]KIV99779.1 hypothetical protein PV09_08585 [Verruconis gallopava]
MAERNHYAQPMDFEYENKRGAVDPSSPFISSLQHSSSFSASQGDLGPTWRLQSEIDQRKTNSQKRPFAQYESPLKKTETPALRPPGAGQSVLFSQPQLDTNKKLPPKPSDAATLWTTPRKSSQLVDFSSGGETPDTENWKADSEATPETTPSMGLSKGFAKLFGSGSKKNGSKAKELISVSKGSPTAGKGEIKPYSQRLVGRVQKKREKEASKRRRLLREAVDSETEADTDVEQKKAKPAAKQGFDVGGFFHYLESHPHLPHVLSFYAQLALNVFLIFGIMYILYSFWSTIRSDVDKKAQEAMAEVLAEIAVCAKHWKDNQCERGTVLPALEAVCREWEKCMNKDHRSIGRARVSAHTFAEIFNSFIEPISWKAMGFTVVVLVFCFAITNATFSLFRRNTDAHPNPFNPSMPQVPPTPQRHPSWEMQPQYGFTPYSSQYGLPPPQWGQPPGLEPAPSQGSLGSQGSPRKVRGTESPKKQRQLEL